jgi:excisionase family DNA binding protein
MTVTEYCATLPNPATVREVATALRVHQETIRRAIARGKLQVVRAGRRGTRIPVQSVEAWLRSHAPNTTDQP